jgi:predicted DNA-binding transcriptional regulator YafY
MSAARVLALLELLQARPGLTGPQLAGRLEVDVRTVRRHVATLDGLGVPVVAERGRYGGYRLLPAALRERVGAVAETLGFTTEGRRGTAPGAEVLLERGEAARGRWRVRIGYRSWRGETSERALDPYGLVFHHGRWYVTGHDARRGEVRIFRLDRIASVGRTEQRFRRPEGFDPVAHVAAGLAGVPYALDVEVVLHGPPDDVRLRLPRTLGTLEPHPDGTLLRARAEDADGMARMLAGLAWRFTVLRPEEVRVAVREHAARLLEDAG